MEVSKPTKHTVGVYNRTTGERRVLGVIRVAADTDAARRLAYEQACNLFHQYANNNKDDNLHYSVCDDSYIIGSAADPNSDNYDPKRYGPRPQDFQAAVEDTSRDVEVIGHVFKELRRGEEKHPGWPNDVIYGVGIITEEVGEAMTEAIDFTRATCVRDRDLAACRLKIELAQAAASAIRMLIHLE